MRVAPLFLPFVTCLAAAAQPLQISWTNNLLTIASPRFPGGKLQVWYLEAFCRSGAWDHDWSKTTLPHKTTLVWADPEGHSLKFRTLVQSDIEALHEIQAGDHAARSVTPHDQRSIFRRTGLPAGFDSGGGCKSSPDLSRPSC
jgi:hypothetical protein